MPFEATPEYDQKMRLAAQWITEHILSTITQTLRPEDRVLQFDFPAPAFMRMFARDPLYTGGTFHVFVTQDVGSDEKARIEVQKQPWVNETEPYAVDFYVSVYALDVSLDMPKRLGALRQSDVAANILHEVIHAIDHLRSDLNPGRDEGYPNSPYEFNAWFQASVYEFELVFRNIRKKYWNQGVPLLFEDFWLMAPTLSKQMLQAQLAFKGKYARKLRVRLRKFHEHLKMRYPVGPLIHPAAPPDYAQHIQQVAEQLQEHKALP